MSTSKFDVKSRASKVSGKSVEIAFKDVSIPEPIQDFMALYKNNSGTSSGFSNFFSIDVLPNFIPIMMFCIYHAVQFSAQIDLKSHAKVSTATLAAYFLTIVYGHILVQDLYLRPSASYAASSFMDEDYQREFVNYILNMPVPKFLEPILARLHTATSPRRANIVYSPSAQGYSFTHHYGRFVPISFFTHIHFMASSVASNSNVHDVFAEYICMNMLTVTDPTVKDSSMDYTPANILGIRVENTNAAYTLTALNNKLYQSFMSIFNPVLLRATQQRQTFAPIYIKPVTVTSSRHSFYHAVFSSTMANLSELRTVFSSVASAMNGVIPCSGDLAKFYDTISGANIITHGYSDYALPTYLASSTSPTETPEKSKRAKLQDDTERAEATGFLQTPKLTASTTKYQYPVCDSDASHDIKMTDKLVLISKSTFTSDDSVPKATCIKYDSRLHFMPPVRVYNPFESAQIDAYLTTLTGMVIESFELDSSIVQMPNPRLHIGVENSQFLMSAVPYAYATRGSKFTYVNNFSNLSISRALHTQENPAFASFLGNSAEIIVPRITETHATGLVSDQLPGLSFLNDVTWTRAFRRFFGGRAALSASPRASNKSKKPSGHYLHSIWLWSPYSFTSPKVEFEDIDDSATAAAAEYDTYFIHNFRTIFGVDPDMTEVSNYLEAMPIV